MEPPSPPLPFADVAEFFEFDGSLRDIIAFDTTLASWQQMIDWLLTTDWNVEFGVDDPSKNCVDVLKQWFAGVGPILNLRCVAGNILLVASPSIPEEIEFTVDPQEIGQENYPSLCDFLAKLAQAIGRNVFVTGESYRPSAKLACTPQGDFVRIDRPKAATEASRALASRLNDIGLFNEAQRLTAETIDRLRLAWSEAVPSPAELRWHTDFTREEASALYDFAWHLDPESRPERDPRRLYERLTSVRRVFAPLAER